MKRFPLPDLLKGLAAFLMVQVHITELFIVQAGQDCLAGRISLFLGGPFAAIVFMIVMGYFIAKNKKTPGSNMLRGIRIFILGFLLNIGLNLNLLLKIQFSGWQFDPLKYIFGVDILFLAGLSIIILACLKFLGKAQIWTAFILFFVVLGLSDYLNGICFALNHYYLLPFVAGNYTWSYFPLFPWLAYPLLGFIFAYTEEKIKQFSMDHNTITYIFTLSVAILVIVFFHQGFNITIDLPAYYHHTFNYAIWAIGLTILWILLLYILMSIPDNIIFRFLCWIGSNITTFFIFQWLILGNISTAIFQTQNMTRFPFYFVGISTLTVFLTYLYTSSQTHLAKK